MDKEEVEGNLSSCVLGWEVRERSGKIENHHTIPSPMTSTQKLKLYAKCELIIDIRCKLDIGCWTLVGHWASDTSLSWI